MTVRSFKKEGNGEKTKQFKNKAYSEGEKNKNRKMNERRKKKCREEKMRRAENNNNHTNSRRNRREDVSTAHQTPEGTQEQRYKMKTVKERRLRQYGYSKQKGSIAAYKGDEEEKKNNGCMSCTRRGVKRKRGREIPRQLVDSHIELQLFVWCLTT